MKPNRRSFLAALFALTLVVGTEAVAIVGRPFTPMSVAGVARRTTRRTVAVGVGAAAVGTAAVVGGAAVTAAAVSSLPYGCYASVPCGGYIYTPQYQGTEVVYVKEEADDDDDEKN